MKIFKFFLDLIAPKKCYSCNKEGHFICPDCFDKEINFSSVCYVCKGTTKNYNVHDDCKNDIHYDKVIILKHYKSHIISKLIKDAKFYNKKEILEEISYYLYEKFLINEKIINKENYIVTSTPSHFFRNLQRGYNTSLILSKYFSKLTGIIVLNNLLKKIKNTKQQSKLYKKQRSLNLKDSFQINKKNINFIKNKNIIIVDDVISTGSTLNEISKILKENGVNKIIGLIIASD